jgi:diamine N-acetyltransferase
MHVPWFCYLLSNTNSLRMITIRPLQEEDFELILDWENRPELWQFSEQQGPFPMEDIKSFHSKCLDHNNTEIKRWLICRETAPIGAVDIFEIDTTNHHCGIGIFITEAHHRKKGYASKALLLALKELHIIGLRLVRAIIYNDNIQSRNLFSKAGFSEGAALIYKGKLATQYICNLQE